MGDLGYRVSLRASSCRLWSTGKNGKHRKPRQAPCAKAVFHLRANCASMYAISTDFDFQTAF